MNGTPLAQQASMAAGADSARGTAQLDWVPGPFTVAVAADGLQELRPALVRDPHGRNDGRDPGAGGHAIVQDLEKDGPAEQGGIKAGDVIEWEGYKLHIDWMPGQTEFER